MILNNYLMSVAYSLIRELNKKRTVFYVPLKKIRLRPFYYATGNQNLYKENYQIPSIQIFAVFDFKTKVKYFFIIMDCLDCKHDFCLLKSLAYAKRTKISQAYFKFIFNNILTCGKIIYFHHYSNHFVYFYIPMLHNI